ncbi:unnamed protein product [Closterium sp. Naga37s-1]|nr:unnamed protein product [Closterium sp. Naga37s-1]
MAFLPRVLPSAWSGPLCPVWSLIGRAARAARRRRSTRTSGRSPSPRPRRATADAALLPLLLLAHAVTLLLNYSAARIVDVTGATVPQVWLHEFPRALRRLLPILCAASIVALDVAALWASATALQLLAGLALKPALLLSALSGLAAIAAPPGKVRPSAGCDSATKSSHSQACTSPPPPPFFPFPCHRAAMWDALSARRIPRPVWGVGSGSPDARARAIDWSLHVHSCPHVLRFCSPSKLLPMPARSLPHPPMSLRSHLSPPPRLSRPSATQHVQAQQLVSLCVSLLLLLPPLLRPALPLRPSPSSPPAALIPARLPLPLVAPAALLPSAESAWMGAALLGAWSAAAHLPPARLAGTPLVSSFPLPLLLSRFVAYLSSAVSSSLHCIASPLVLFRVRSLRCAVLSGIRLLLLRSYPFHVLRRLKTATALIPVSLYLASHHPLKPPQIARACPHAGKGRLGRAQAREAGGGRKVHRGAAVAAVGGAAAAAVAGSGSGGAAGAGRCCRGDEEGGGRGGRDRTHCRCCRCRTATASSCRCANVLPAPHHLYHRHSTSLSPVLFRPSALPPVPRLSPFPLQLLTAKAAPGLFALVLLAAAHLLAPSTTLAAQLALSAFAFPPPPASSAPPSSPPLRATPPPTSPLQPPASPPSSSLSSPRFS